MHADNITSATLVHKPHVVATLCAVFLIVFFLWDFSEGGLANWFSQSFNIADGKDLRLITTVVLSAALVINIVILGFFPRKLQIIIVWIELAALFIGFFLIFDLSFSFIQSKLWFLIHKGVVTTLYVSAISIVIAFVIAIVGSIAKLSNNGFAIAIATFYTSLFRGLPLLMQVYLIYLGLPQLGYVVGAIPAGVAALSLCYGAYMTEIFRAGIESIPKGQWEASRAMGFRFSLIMRRIILPQAIPVIIPPTGNQFIAMLKDSSLVSVIGVWELMFLAKRLGSKTFQHMEMLITVAIIYWILTMALEVVQSRIEKHYNRKR